MSCLKPNSLPGIAELLAEVVHDLDREHGVRAALVQLAGRVQVARAEALRHDAAGLARAHDERIELALALGVDERLDGDVLRRLRLREQVVE